MLMKKKRQIKSEQTVRVAQLYQTSREMPEKRP